MLRIKQIKAALAGVIMLGCTVSADAFVLIGQPNPNETMTILTPTPTFNKPVIDTSPH